MASPIFKYSILGPNYLNLSKNRASYTVATHLSRLPVISLSLPSSPFFALLYNTEEGPCKHFFANPYHVRVCRERMLEELWRRKGFLLVLVLIPMCFSDCSCNVQWAACGAPDGTHPQQVPMALRGQLPRESCWYPGSGFL